VSFRSTNSRGEGSYFEGIAVNHTVPDGLDKDWGDVQESALQSVINYINAGAYRSSRGDAGSTIYQQKREVVESNNQLDLPSFKGTIDTRRM
jgi:hypothetical protein